MNGSVSHRALTVLAQLCRAVVTDVDCSLLLATGHDCSHLRLYSGGTNDRCQPEARSTIDRTHEILGTYVLAGS